MHVQFNPYEKCGGGEGGGKSFSHIEGGGGGKKFPPFKRVGGGVKVLPFLEGGGGGEIPPFKRKREEGGGHKNVHSLLGVGMNSFTLSWGGGAQKVSNPRFSHFVAPPSL